MNFTVVPFEDVDRAGYLALLSACRWATVFHSLEWMPIYELFSPRSRQLVACAEDGGELVAALPITVFQRLGMRAVFSSGFSLYGGPIARPGCPEAALSGLLEVFVHTAAGPRTALSALHDLNGRCAGLAAAGYRRREATTHVMDLPGDRVELDRRLPRGALYPVRRAAREGVSVTRSRRRDELEQWQQLCRRNYLAHGRRPLPDALFAAVARRLEESDCLRFHVAKIGERVVGGAVIVVALGRAHYWMAATDPSVRRLGVNHAVIHTTLGEAVDQGLASVDFGVTPAGATGVSAFKEKWGLSEHRFSWYERSTLVGRVAARWLRHGGPAARWRGGDGGR